MGHTMKKVLIILALLLVSTSTNASKTVSIDECGMYEMKAYYETMIYLMVVDTPVYDYEVEPLTPESPCFEDQVRGSNHAIDEVNAARDAYYGR
jgi:hypothetical protein